MKPGTLIATLTALAVGGYFLLRPSQAEAAPPRQVPRTSIADVQRELNALLASRGEAQIAVTGQLDAATCRALGWADQRFDISAAALALLARCDASEPRPSNADFAATATWLNRVIATLEVGMSPAIATEFGQICLYLGQVQSGQWDALAGEVGTNEAYLAARRGIPAAAVRVGTWCVARRGV